MLPFNLTRELPILTYEIIGKSISSIDVVKNDLTLDDYFEQMYNGLKTYVFKLDNEGNNVVYNYNGTYVKDKEGEQLSKLIAEHPETCEKKKELTKKLRRLISEL